jgi:hypothetical protein
LVNQFGFSRADAEKARADSNLECSTTMDTTTQQECTSTDVSGIESASENQVPHNRAGHMTMTTVTLQEDAGAGIIVAA